MEKGTGVLFIVLIGAMSLYIGYDMGYLENIMGTSQPQPGIHKTWINVNTSMHLCEKFGGEVIPGFNVEFEVEEGELVYMNFQANIMVFNEDHPNASMFCFFYIDGRQSHNVSCTAEFNVYSGLQDETISMSFYNNTMEAGNHTIGIRTVKSGNINDYYVDTPILLVQTIIT